jgi:hypothetical protein
MVYILTEVLRVLRPDLPAHIHADIRGVVQRACRFASRSTEDYAFIANHQALFALAFLNANELLGDAAYRQRAEEIIQKIISKQSPDGWYLEYEGPDPGYESLGIFYLATYWKRTGSKQVLESLRRSVEFYAHCVHPDGSVGGNYGSRHTSLYFPAGFEILASEISLASAISEFMQGLLTMQNVVTPAGADVQNLPSLAYTYLEACLITRTEHNGKLPLLPCQRLQGLQHFPDSDVTIAATSYYYAVLNLSTGGVCRVFDKHTSKVFYEDAGYLVLSGNRLWSSQLVGIGHRLNSNRPNHVACTTILAEVRQELPSPAKFLLLRLLNLTLFRNLAVGACLRRLIVRRLITTKRIGPLQFNRSVSFQRDSIHFRDTLRATRNLQVKEVALPRLFTAVHMGSAKYFHSSELETMAKVPVDHMASKLQKAGVATFEFTLRFSRSSGPEFVFLSNNEGGEIQEVTKHL